MTGWKLANQIKGEADKTTITVFDTWYMLIWSWGDYTCAKILKKNEKLVEKETTVMTKMPTELNVIWNEMKKNKNGNVIA